MHLPMRAFGLLGLAVFGAQATPTWMDGGKGADAVLVEKVSPRGEFVNEELQQRASRFLTQWTAPFAVDGTNLPNVSWNVGESYAGLIPISDDFNETRKLFFWFFPTTNPEPTNDVIVWLNGGPGCSSMEGLLSENGPINWFDGTASPTQNPYTWVNISSMVWVDQPVGVGFSQGEIDIYTQEELALEFAGFWKNFIQLFCMENWRMYITGESYAGVYIPYIAAAFIDSGDIVHYNLVGVAMNDPYIGSGGVQMNTPIPAYAKHWNIIMGLNDSFLEQLAWRTKHCGIDQYIAEHLTFPPPDKHFKELGFPNDTFAIENCNMFDIVFNAAKLINPCFSWYHILDTCPYPSSELDPTDPATDRAPFSSALYFNDPLVRAALHVPEAGVWEQCVNKIFLDRETGQPTIGDPYSNPPAQTDIFRRMIEYTNNVIIGVGGLDALIPTNGTLMALQNVTWHGKQGLQQWPGEKFFSPYHTEYNTGAQSMAGIVGTWGTERGLTFYEIPYGGHELPRYAPGPTFRVVELMLGRISNLSEVSDFTTQRGNMNDPAEISW